MINYNRQKVEEIFLSRLREQRKPLLEELDVLFMRAVELSQSTEEIAYQKQLLRDVTEKDFSALSVQELVVMTIQEALSYESAATIQEEGESE